MHMCLKLRDANLTVRQGSVCCWAMVQTERVDLGHMKVIHSRDVVFDEASMPGMEKEKETTTRYVELEIEGEETVTPNPSDAVTAL